MMDLPLALSLSLFISPFPQSTTQLFIRVSLFDPRHVARLVRILETGTCTIVPWEQTTEQYVDELNHHR
jgi:hypothetical protein